MECFELTFRVAQLLHLYAKLGAFLIKMAALQAESLGRFRHIVASALEFGANRRALKRLHPGRRAAPRR